MYLRPYYKVILLYFLRYYFAKTTSRTPRMVTFKLSVYGFHSAISRILGAKQLKDIFKEGNEGCSCTTYKPPDFSSISTS